jgi:hypothetical protein
MDRNTYPSEFDVSGSSEERGLLNAAYGQNLRFSNFMLTLSTNVKPKNDDEKDSLTNWLVMTTNTLFNDWAVCNGTVLKPAGSPNGDGMRFPANCKIISVKSRISVEQGDNQHGQVHAHVLLEVAHEYTRQEHGAEGIGHEVDKPIIGVHVNVTTLREYLNSRIGEMDIESERRPPKIYVNSRLLTKGTDNSNKWLTLQYINKDRARDNGGGTRNLRADEGQAADPALSRARQLLIRGGEEHGPEEYEIAPSTNGPDWRDDDFGVGGALSPPGSPLSDQFNAPGRGIPQDQRFRVPAVPPPMNAVTSAVNIGGKRYNRGAKPGRYRD